MDGKKRCRWCNLNNQRYIDYHDNEWGVARFDDEYLYEMLLLESFQAGLSWECVLNKREAFRSAYDGFDIEKVVLYDETKVEELMAAFRQFLYRLSALHLPIHSSLPPSGHLLSCCL